MALSYREMSLPEFVAQCNSQGEAADKLGCTQGNVSQAIADIKAGTKKVNIRVYKNGSIEADIIKPFGKTKAA